MKILFLTSRLPYPPDRGDRLRVYHFAQQLSQEHELTLVSFIKDAEQRKFFRNLQTLFSEIHVIPHTPIQSLFSTAVGLVSGEALQIHYYRSQAMDQLLERLNSRPQYDMVYTHLIRMAPYGLQVKNAFRVLDLTDVISNEIRLSLEHRRPPVKWLYEFELPRLIAAENKYSAMFDENWVISTSERDALQKQSPSAEIRIVANGVDFSSYQPKQQQPNNQSLLFVGHMGVFHNIDAARYLAQEIMPLIYSQHPGATLGIVGAEPAREVQALARIPGVQVRGYLPDLPSALQQACVFAAPIRFAGGIQNKVLEAMATATPVVTTSIVNRGIRAQAGREIILADDPGSFAGAISELLDHPDFGREVGMAGYEFVRRNFSWGQVKQAVNELPISRTRTENTHAPGLF